MKLNHKKANKIASEFLKRWPLTKIKQMSLEQYVGTKDKDTFCYWIETRTRYLGSIKGHYSNKFGIYERNPDAKLPKTDSLKYDTKYVWWKKYGLQKGRAFENVKQLITEIIDASKAGKFEKIDAININHLVKWKVASLYSKEQILPIFSKKTIGAIAKDYGITIPKNKYSIFYKSILKTKPNDKNIYQFAADLYFKYEENETPPNYWLTVHWPRLKGQNKKSIPSGVFIPDGRQKAGKDLKKGDRIIIYESFSGRTVLSKDIDGNEIKTSSQIGKMGIVAIVEATTNLRHDPDEQPTYYNNSNPITWSWYAETKLLTQNGFVSLKEVNRVLGYKETYNLRGFGDFKSGLKKLTEDQFEQLLIKFKKNSKQKRKSSTQKFGRGGESPAHLRLKNFVADDPENVLKEEGLTTVQVEYPFPSADKADILLMDRWGKYIGVEIELEHNLNRFEGVLQAIKYRFMAAYMFGVDYSETRSMLIAHKISKGLIEQCKKYDVECHIIKESDMI